MDQLSDQLATSSEYLKDQESQAKARRDARYKRRLKRYQSLKRGTKDDLSQQQQPGGKSTNHKDTVVPGKSEDDEEHTTFIPNTYKDDTDTLPEATGEVEVISAAPETTSMSECGSASNTSEVTLKRHNTKKTWKERVGPLSASLSKKKGVDEKRKECVQDKTTGSGGADVDSDPSQEMMEKIGRDPVDKANHHMNLLMRLKKALSVSKFLHVKHKDRGEPCKSNTADENEDAQAEEACQQTNLLLRFKKSSSKLLRSKVADEDEEDILVYEDGKEEDVNTDDSESDSQDSCERKQGRALESLRHNYRVAKLMRPSTNIYSSRKKHIVGGCLYDPIMSFCDAE